MTDYIDTKQIKLNEAQRQELLADGEAAADSMNAAGSNPPPVGVWQKMYHDIDTMMGANAVSGWIADQEYWFSQAGFINGDNENVPSGYFVRDITAVGFGVDSPSDPEVQAVSNQIGFAIYNSIKSTGNLPAFWQQLNYDIYSALDGGVTPYPYPKLPISGWGVPSITGMPLTVPAAA